MAVSASTHFMALAILVIVGMINFGYSTVPGQCKGNLDDFAEQCYESAGIGGPEVQPSVTCCDVVREFDIPCLCKYLSSDDEVFVAPDRIVYIADSCGQALSHGTKCGTTVKNGPNKTLG
ncbi:uncharacterized protein LOC132296290 [Cornus florida]|uniref:uncharacterized protein LOC132296290 n=1 Tax=Cornus florida TaxID=4283 RepID=UPI0028A27642|nr:uncharacterized protein LOC132296290 [Cornus florida]